MLSLPVGALITSILVVDDIRDVEFDAVKGTHTIAVRFGRRWSRAEFVGLLTIAYALPFWFWRGLGFGPLALLPLVTAPLVVVVSRDVLTRKTFAEISESGFRRRSRGSPGSRIPMRRR